MTAEPLALVLRYVRRLADAEALALLTDGQLLERFASQNDEAAFAVLMERYGGLVLGVCRRLLSTGHDVEDAFQATFLVLARRASKLDRRGPLGGWLHTVAYHLALKVRADRGRQRQRERKAAREIETAPEAESMEEWRPILDEELQRLPEKYRLPLVLCYLQSKTNAEAAAALGWPVGSMSRRLARARELLRERLVRRGVGLPAAPLVVAMAGEIKAAVPTTLLTMTARAAVAFGRGQALAEGSASAPTVARTYLREMVMTKLRILVAVVLVSGLAVGGVVARQAIGKKPGGVEPVAEHPRLSQDSPVADGKKNQEHVPARLHQGDIPIGSLGHALGDYLTIEGKRANGPKFGNSTLRVDTINGKKLARSVDIWVENIRELPQNLRIKLKGYETGAMQGPVPAAIQAAREKGQQVLLPQRGWQWSAYFIALSSVTPKLAIEARPTGFKTQKPGEDAAPLHEEPQQKSVIPDGW